MRRSEFAWNFESRHRLEPLLWALEALNHVETETAYHPEGNALNHSLQCFRWACRESDDIDLIMAALLHDVGKARGSHGHEKTSVELLVGNVSDKTLWLVQNHMRIWPYLLGEMKRLGKSRRLSTHPWFASLCKLARFDQLGRNPNLLLHRIYDSEKLIEELKQLQK